MSTKSETGSAATSVRKKIVLDFDVDKQLVYLGIRRGFEQQCLAPGSTELILRCLDLSTIGFPGEGIKMFAARAPLARTPIPRPN